jgi:hypothetical protein
VRHGAACEDQGHPSEPTIIRLSAFAKGSCVNVSTSGHPQFEEDKRLTANGRFEAVNHVGRYTLRGEIDADEGSP